MNAACFTHFSRQIDGSTLFGITISKNLQRSNLSICVNKFCACFFVRFFIRLFFNFLNFLYFCFALLWYSEAYETTSIVANRKIIQVNICICMCISIRICFRYIVRNFSFLPTSSLLLLELLWLLFRFLLLLYLYQLK